MGTGFARSMYTARFRVLANREPSFLQTRAGAIVGVAVDRWVRSFERRASGAQASSALGTTTLPCYCPSAMNKRLRKTKRVGDFKVFKVIAEQ